MKRIVVACLALSASLAAQSQLSPATQLPPAAAVRVNYDKDVKPLLAQNCYGCHGPSAQQGGLRLDLRQNALRGGDYGPVIIPGKSAESKLIKRVVDGDGGMQMPPTGALTADEIGILRAWIDQGAEFRTDVVEAPVTPTDPKLAAAIDANRRSRVDAATSRGRIWHARHTHVSHRRRR
jgi:mono/diheme cytochrome c family protein